MNLKDIKFLTTNPKKSKDFTDYGLGVRTFEQEIIEVLSPDVEVVVLHKAKDTKLNNIVVEDTSLLVEGADFYGTQIKHVYEKIKNDENFNNHKAIWEVSLCMKSGEYFYISTGRTEGILKYPALDVGYHFDRIFAIKNSKNEFQHFELYTNEEKQIIGPRFKALKLLTESFKNKDHSKLKVIHESNVLEWDGEYQVEIKKEKKIKL